MIKGDKYQLYISNKCNCCDKILLQLEKDNIDISIVNIDVENYKLPFTLMILPALVKENKLVGYGFKDILNHISNT